MLRIILSFVAGFAVAKLFATKSSVEEVKAVAQKTADKITKTSRKVADVIKEEFGKKETEKPQEAEASKETENTGNSAKEI